MPHADTTHHLLPELPETQTTSAGGAWKTPSADKTPGHTSSYSAPPYPRATEPIYTLPSTHVALLLLFYWEVACDFNKVNFPSYVFVL